MADSQPVNRMRVLLYSSNRDVRAQVVAALGKRPASDVPEIEVEEFATEPAVMRRMDEGGVDLAILDGEAAPGGIGMCRQIKDEIYDSPPILILTGRPQDAWLATWSRADAVIPRPLSAFDLARGAGELLRQRARASSA